MESQIGSEDRFVNPAEAVRLMKVTPGMRVADIGAGSGAYAFALASAVGEEGVVYAIEVQQEMLTRIANQAEQRGISNIEVLWGDAERPLGTKLADGSVDMAIMSNILFQFEVKEDALREAHRILKPGGSLVIIEWSDSFGGMGPALRDVVSPASAKQAADSAGFALSREFTPGTHHYGLVYTKVN